MKKIILINLLLILAMIPAFTFSQDILSGGKVTGNVQIDGQFYNEDSKLGISDSSLNYKKFGMNGFANFIYTNGDFSAGMRAEGFLNPMLGFDPRYEGFGVPYWFAKYKAGSLEMTAGHFYEQFGSGLVLRSWEEWTLGYDNNIYGFNVHFSPIKGVMLKGLVGTQRYFWEPYENSNRGIVRGFDGDFYLNDMFESMAESKTKIDLGGSFVSRYEKVPNKTFSRDSVYTKIDTLIGSNDTIFISSEWNHRTTYQYNLPYNVGSWAARANIANGGFNFYLEYAQKGNDPNATNNYIYKKGSAVYSTLSYSTKGLGLFLATKWIDNMNYKSKLTESGNPSMLDINYLPAITKEQPYSMATVYPYATKQNGEFGVQAQVAYNIPKNSAVGGKYGTNLTFNYSLAKSIQKDPVSANIPVDSSGTEGYKTNFFSIGDLMYYQDFNVLAEKKFSSKVKAKLAYFNQTYNKNVIEDDIFDDLNMVHANIAVLDLTYKFDAKNSLRMELQGLWSREEKSDTTVNIVKYTGNWAAMMLEYTFSPTWFISVQDEFNYGNPVSEDQIHYYNFSFGYNEGSNRISLRYGRQREGLLCVGGVCRYVPASTGLTITLTSSF